jgi:L-tyrosine C(3)-methyltransferase
LLLENVDLRSVRKLLDVGGGDATNAIAIASACPSMSLTLLDLPETAKLAAERVAQVGLTDRIRIWSGDMFKDSFPVGFDCVLFAHQLVIWPLDAIVSLLSRAYQSLTEDGFVVIFSSISADEGGPLFAALDSAYFLSLPAPGGKIHSWNDYSECLKSAGFKRIETRRPESWTPHGIVIAYK